jgi:DNA-binding PadR family transcriptional regulator
MSLEHAILGFLQYQPYSGYDLKKVFDTSVQHFWPADQSQIYRTLSRLTHEGWAEVELIEQEGRPDRKAYHITVAGREELRRWLLSPVAHEESRSAPLVQVFFAGQLDDQEILAIFERTAQELREALERYDQVPEISAPYREMVDDPREDFFWMLTLECGVSMARAKLEWIESVIDRIKEKKHPAKTTQPEH